MRTNLSRLLIGLVFFINIQCAIVFILFPSSYAPSFELPGEPGEAMVRALGVLFLMWNVPYAVALWNPVRYQVSLFEAIVMQAIGLAGEFAIYLGLPSAFAVARASICRFMIFDGIGLAALLAAIWLIRANR